MSNKLDLSDKIIIGVMIIVAILLICLGLVDVSYDGIIGGIPFDNF